MSLRRQACLGANIAVGALTSPGWTAGAAPVKVLDRNFGVGAGMLAHTEYELAGEPLAQALDLDLDVVDADQADKPTALDFAAGIASYENSEEAMDAVNYPSRLAPDAVNAMRGGTLAQTAR